MNSTNTKRIEYIDLAKGICILLVVLDHSTNYGYFSNGDYPLNDIFGQTRMPLYFILSGLFFKNYAGGIREFLLRKTNRILVPYIFFMGLYRILAWCTRGCACLSVNDVWMWVWAPLWFLLCLFWMNTIFVTAYYVINRYISNSLIAEIVLACFVFSVGITGYHIGQVRFAIGIAMTCLPFLWMGYLLNRKLHFFQQRISWQWALPMGIVLLGALHYLYMGKNYFFLNTYAAPLPLVYLFGLMGTLGVLLLSRVIKWLPVISYIGRYSIIVLCTHMGVLELITAAFNLLPDNKDNSLWQTLWANNAVQSWTVLALTIACCSFLCWLLSKYLPWFTAQKDLIKIHLS